MENTNKDFENWHELSEQAQKQHRRARRFAGLLFVIAGSLFIAKHAGALIPDWIFTWQMFLIALGVFIGAKHNFNGAGWLVPILIGSIFMTQEFYPDIVIRPYLWPAAIILFGLMLIFKPRKMNRFRGGRFRESRRWKRHYWEQYAQSQADASTVNAEDRVEITAVFGEIKKNIISKDFKGGEVTCVFGGAEINLSQADINGNVVIECTQVFGGAKFIVPRHWKIQSEPATAVFGGIEDKRAIIDEALIDHTKTLILQGTCVFGGIEIRSF